MKKTFRILAVILALTLSMSMLAACGESSGNGGKEETKKSSGDFEISEIDWVVEGGIDRGDRILVFNYTNNTEYPIMSIKMEFKEKAGVKEETRTHFYDHIKDLMNFDENDPDDQEDYEEIIEKGLTMNLENESYVKPGEKSGNARCRYFSTLYIVDEESYLENVEPDFAEIKYLKDSKAYTVVYDFVNDKYTIDKNVKDAGIMPSTEIAKKVPVPEDGIIVASYSTTTLSSFYVYDITREQYDKYVQACKDIGFKEDLFSSDRLFSGKNDDGDDIDVDYYADSSKMYVSISNYK